MLTENVICLSSPRNTYDEFAAFLRNSFSTIKTFTECNGFMKAVESIIPNNTWTSPLLVFVEYSFLNEIGAFLSNRLDELNYILIGFELDEPVSRQSNPAKFSNIFEFVNTSKFNARFLINKITNEISSRKNILSQREALGKFYEIGKALSSQKDTIKLLEMIATSSISLTNSDAATIYLVIDKVSYNWTSIKNNDYEDKLLKFIISRNTSINIDLEAHASAITRESIFGYSVITGKAIRIDDAYNLKEDVEYHHNNTFDSQIGYLTKSILTIPMKDHENNILGVIQLINKKKDGVGKIDYKNPESIEKIISYTYSDEIIISSLAGQAAVALENNLLYNSMQALLNNLKQQNTELDILSKRILEAHEEERRRIAREIHDGPAQALVNFSIRIELARKYLQRDMAEKAVEELSSLNSNIKDTSREIRTIIYDLKPAYMDDGIIKALENRLQILQESTDMDVKFTFAGEDSKLDQYISHSLYRIIQEALTNIQKHAHAKNVTVDLKIYHNGISVEVADDGVGFDTTPYEKKSLTGGFGLSGLKERVELLRGRVDIKSAKGQGTSMNIYIPL